MTATVTFSITEPLATYGHDRGEIDRAIGRAFAYYERNCDIDLRIVPRGGRYRIAAKTIYIGRWMHARGQQVGRTVYIHNGWVPANTTPQPRGFWWDAFPAGETAIGSILGHEIGHAVFFGRSHSRDTRCLMHINASVQELCPTERSQLVRRYGPPKPPPPPPPPIPEYDWTNPDNKYDVNDDGRVTSRDALAIINAMPITVDKSIEPKYFYDVNDDGIVSSRDALAVINQLRRQRDD